jgi:hypothetical protein
MVKRRYPAPKGTQLTRSKLSKNEPITELPKKPEKQIPAQTEPPKIAPTSSNVPTRALSIRQPYVEMILRGIKTIEYRSQPTKIRERVYLYASLQPGNYSKVKNLNIQDGDLLTGAILGTVEVVGCTGVPGDYEWHLANPERLPAPLKPERKPQPVWFIPFKDD